MRYSETENWTWFWTDGTTNKTVWGLKGAVPPWVLGPLP